MVTNQGNCHGPLFQGLCTATVIAGSAVVFRETAGKREKRWCATADLKMTMGSFVNSQSTMHSSTKSENCLFLSLSKHLVYLALLVTSFPHTALLEIHFVKRNIREILMQHVL